MKAPVSAHYLTDSPVPYYIYACVAMPASTALDTHLGHRLIGAQRSTAYPHPHPAAPKRNFVHYTEQMDPNAVN